MSGIDWNKAGKGFDFHFKGKAAKDAGDFYCISPLNDRFVSEAGSYILFRDIKNLPGLLEISMRPDDSTWTGSGLPPVGTVCECHLRGGLTNKYSWVEARVIWHNGPTECAVIRSTSRLAWCDEFRPIRTQEQIAAEEREEAIKQFMQIGDIYWDTASALYDAGARLPGKGAKA